MQRQYLTNNLRQIRGTGTASRFLIPGKRYCHDLGEKGRRDGPARYGVVLMVGWYIGRERFLLDLSNCRIAKSNWNDLKGLSYWITWYTSLADHYISGHAV